MAEEDRVGQKRVITPSDESVGAIRFEIKESAEKSEETDFRRIERRALETERVGGGHVSGGGK